MMVWPDVTVAKYLAALTHSYVPTCTKSHVNVKYNHARGPVVN